MKLTRVAKRLTDALDQGDESLVKLSDEYPDGNPVNDVSYDTETTLWGADPAMLYEISHA